MTKLLKDLANVTGKAKAGAGKAIVPDVPTGEMKVELVHLDKIMAGQNDRTVFDPDRLEALANTIEEDGLVNPITIRPSASKPDRYEIVAGERRYRAFRLLQKRTAGLSDAWDTIPSVIKDLSDEEASMIMLAENVIRDSLNPMDEAEGLQKRMNQFGWSVLEMAKRANVAVRRVEQLLSLLELIPEARDLIRRETMSMNWAMCLRGLDTNRQREAIRQFATDANPSLANFQLFCGKLAEQQLEESAVPLSMFESAEYADGGLNTAAMDNLMQDAKDARAKSITRYFPVNPDFPEFKRDGKMGIGEAFEYNIALLLKAGDIENAAILGSLYKSFVKNAFSTIPRNRTTLNGLWKENTGFVWEQPASGGWVDKSDVAPMDTPAARKQAKQAKAKDETPVAAAQAPATPEPESAETEASKKETDHQ